LLGQCERSFRRHIERFEADGLEGLLDKRLCQISKRRASSAEIGRGPYSCIRAALLVGTFAHFHSKYKAEFASDKQATRLRTRLLA
jgi:hypothetical protein